MSEVKRYTESCMEGGGVAPDYNGEFVEWKDYEKLRSELAALKAGQGEALAYVSEESFSSNGTSDIITCNLPIGTALYTAPPASADAVSVPVELLERVSKADASIGANAIQLADGWKAMTELRALLARSESKGVKS